MKTNSTTLNSFEAYFANFSPEVCKILEEIRTVIRKNAPLASEVISYQMPTFKQGRNLVHFAAYANHIGFYPGASGIAHFLDEIKGKYVWGKGSVQFPLSEPIPYELIARIVQFRVKEELERK